MENSYTRRRFLHHLAMGTGGFMVAGQWPLRAAFAAPALPTQKRLLVVVLRGALDGLAAIIPHGDRHYMDARRGMAIPFDAVAATKIDGMYAFHPALSPLLEIFTRGEMVVLHATATPYRERSHFDAQNLLEEGGSSPHALDSGWLNRTLRFLNGPHNATALGPATPLILRGPTKVGNWAPATLPNVDPDLLARVMEMYAHDPLLLETLGAAQGMQDSGGGMGGGQGGPRAFVGMMAKAADFMGKGNVRIATVEMGGWDTHAGQGLLEGKLANNFTILAEGLRTYRDRMGTQWRDTAVLVVTEFGRTVAGNGSGGTDHGTGSVAFLLGGSLRGGRVIGDWPGLAKLYEGRDLMPANDLRRLLKATLMYHFSIGEPQLSTHIFPGSGHFAPYEDLFNPQPGGWPPSHRKAV